MTKTDNGELTSGAVTGKAFGQYGSAEILLIDSINVDGSYQRDLRHDLVNTIGKGWDIVKAGEILVSARADGTLWCVDGQHRMAGAQLAGETEIFAHVIHGLTQEQEAELRLARNDRKSDTIAEKFRARLVMGDQTAHQILELVKQQGTEINLVPNSYHGINAIATVEVLYKIDETGVWLSRTLRVIREAFSNGADEDRFIAEGIDPQMTPETCSTSMLKSVCWFLSQHVDAREVGEAEFIKRMSSMGTEDLRRKAVSHKSANGGALWVNYYRGLVEIWNFRRTEKQKIKWKTTGSILTLGSSHSGPGTVGTSWDKSRSSNG